MRFLKSDDEGAANDNLQLKGDNEMRKSLLEFLRDMFDSLLEFVIIDLLDWIIWIVPIGLCFLVLWLVSKIGVFDVLIAWLVIAAVLKVVSFIFGAVNQSGVARSDDFLEEPEEEKKRMRYGYREPGLLDIWADGAKENRCHNCQHYFCGHCMLQNDDVEMRHTCNRFKEE